MRKATSLYLDVLRVTAALVVFVGHCTELWYKSIFQLMMRAGHDAVVVFFVLSGYVIAYSTLSKSRGPKAYVLARLSRLYSVVVPALVLTAVLLVVGQSLNLSYYHSHDFWRGHEGGRFVLTFFYLQEVWGISASPPTNAPFWSLGYEFWYYALFAAAVFIKSPWAKWLTLVALALVVGYKVLLLMPIWMMGVVLCRYGNQVPIASGVAKVGFFAGLAAFFAMAVYVPDYPLHHGFPPFFYSGAFVTDWATGAALTLSIWCFDRGFGMSVVNAKLEKAVRWFADHTFSLYLYHFTLIVFATAVVHFDKTSPWQTALVIGSVLAIILLLSTFTESKRKWWHQGFTRIWERFEGSKASSSANLPKEVVRSEV